MLGFSFFHKPALKHFYDVIMATMQARKKSGARRNDFVDHILDALKDKKKTDKDEDAHGDAQFEKDAKVMKLFFLSKVVLGVSTQTMILLRQVAVQPA